MLTVDLWQGSNRCLSECVFESLLKHSARSWAITLLRYPRSRLWWNGLDSAAPDNFYKFILRIPCVAGGTNSVTPSIMLIVTMQGCIAVKLRLKYRIWRTFRVSLSCQVVWFGKDDVASVREEECLGIKSWACIAMNISKIEGPILQLSFPESVTPTQLRNIGSQRCWLLRAVSCTVVKNRNSGAILPSLQSTQQSRHIATESGKILSHAVKVLNWRSLEKDSSQWLHSGVSHHPLLCTVHLPVEHWESMKISNGAFITSPLI